MGVDLLLLVLGLFFLLGGGEALVRGASQIAVATGVSPLVVGLTIVAFGTSAPELAVNIIAAYQESTALSFGNIFGSNMANIGLILGTSGLLRALSIQSVIVTREIPMMLVATLAAILMSFDKVLSDNATADEFNRLDGMLLLLLFGVFLYYTVGDVARQWEGGSTGLDEDEVMAPSTGRSVVRAVLLTVGGLGALLYGAELTVGSALDLAVALGVSEVIIGLTLVALGTSLPELTTCVIATLRGHVDLAVGNVVGSNIFNILLVAGATATIRPIPVPDMGHTDLGITLLLSIGLWWAARTRNRVIVHSEAGLLLVVYLTYVTWRSFFYTAT